MSIFIIVTGLPASGKTTLAKELARRLLVPHMDKDTFLENLFLQRKTGAATKSSTAFILVETSEL
jgi:adenylate kinase family enzyme